MSLKGVAEIIRLSVAAAAPQAGVAGVKLLNASSGSVPALFDPTRIGQFLDNLLSNSIK